MSNCSLKLILVSVECLRDGINGVQAFASKAEAQWQMQRCWPNNPQAVRGGSTGTGTAASVETEAALAGGDTCRGRGQLIYLLFL